MIARRNILVVTVLLAASGSSLAASPGESIVLDPATGNYDVTYCGIGPIGSKNACMLHRVVFEPATKIDPILKSYFALDGSGNTTYRFRVENGKRARQPLLTFLLDPVSDLRSSQPLPKRPSDVAPGQLGNALAAGTAALVVPSGWHAFELPNPSGVALRVAWADDSKGEGGARGLGTGRKQTGFGLASADLPGIIAAQFRGNPTHELAFPDEGPGGDISAQLDTLQLNDFVTAFAAVPSIAVPSPFDRAELLRRIDNQLKTWVDLKLLDPVVFSRIDGFIQAAIAAASNRSPESYRAHIGNIEKQVHEIYESLEDSEDGSSGERSDSPLISRLAARVLIFDLDYVLHRDAPDG